MANTDINNISLSFAKCFNGPDADIVLGHLRKITIERIFGPSVDDNTLRFIEGQRYLVQYIYNIIERGRDPKSGQPDTFWREDQQFGENDERADD